MANEKKCPHCGSWNAFPTNKVTLTCGVCGKEVDDEIAIRRKLLQENRQKQLDEWMFKINEGDSIFVRFFKSVGNIVYLIFMAIGGFIAWLVAALPG